MLFTEDWVLAKMLPYQVEDGEAVGEWAEHVVGILHFSCALLASCGLASTAFRLEFWNEIVITLVTFLVGVADRIVAVRSVVGIVVGIGFVVGPGPWR